MKYLKKNWSYIIAPLTVVIILLIIYGMKGLFPFGDKTIIQADLGQSYVPVFYNIHDILRNSGSFLWSFNLGIGSNFYGSFVLNALFSPFTLIFGLIERSQIINYINILLILKTVIMSLTSIYTFKKIYKNTKEEWFYIFGLLYALSGYVLLNYHNIVWFDSLIVFPLFCLSFKHLLDTGKSKWYVITLSIMLILSYYISYMVLMMIIFVGSLYIIMISKKELRKKITMKLVLSTLLALAISAFAFIPSFMQSSASMRLSNVVTSSSLENPHLFTKLNFFTCTSLPIFLVIKGLIVRRKEEKKISLFFILTIIFTMIGIFLEPINKMWHTGSYNGFPYRYGFIPLFILSLISLYYLNERIEKKKNRKEKRKYSKKKEKVIIDLTDKNIKLKTFALVTIFLLTMYLVIRLSPYILKYEIVWGLLNSGVIITLITVFIFFLLMIYLISLLKDKKIRNILTVVITIIQIFINTYWYIGIDNKNISLYEHKDEALKLENSIAEDVDLERNNIDRYKDQTSRFESNYAYMLNVPTISNWIHIQTSDQYNLHQSLGYSNNYTRNLDLGGTLFSDAFYHVKYVFSEDKLTSKVYNEVNKYQDITLYEKKTLPFGYLNNNEELGEYNDSFTYQNELYKKVFNQENNIIDEINPTYEIVDDHYKTEINLNNRSELYLYIDPENYNAITNIKVNDQDIYVKKADNLDNRSYPTIKNNGILTLGTFKGKVILEFDKEELDDINDLKIGYIVLGIYNNFIDNNNYYKTEVETDGSNMKIITNSNDRTHLLVPITYNEGWQVLVNNKEVEVEKYATSYMNIPLEEGRNIIELHFEPPMFKTSILISIMALLIFIIMTLLNKKYKIDEIKLFQYIFTIVGGLLYIIFIIFIYIKPFI